MGEIILELKTLLPHQQYIMRNKKRFNVICAGRRGGKTAMIEYLALGDPTCNALQQFITPDGKEQGKKIAIFSPSYRTLGEIWREVVATAHNVIVRKDTQEKRLDLLGGGVIEFWSLDNIDVARGRKYNRAIVDEAAISANLQVGWQEVIRAHLVDYSGDAFFLSTPKGAGTFFHDLYMNGVNLVDGWCSFQFPSSANPYIPKEEIEDARRTLPPHIFAQEFLAEFVSDSTDMWLYAFDMSRHTTMALGGSMQKVGYLPEYPVYVACDFNNDPLEASIWQFGGNAGEPGAFIHCIDSFSIKGKVDELGMRIRSKYPVARIFICGDASGSQEDVGRNQTLYQILASSMGVPMRDVKLNKRNLWYGDSRILCNVMFQNYPRLVIESDEMVRQINIAVVEQGGKQGELKKDRNKFKLDLFDSMRYFFQTFWLDFARKKYLKSVKFQSLKD